MSAQRLSILVIGVVLIGAAAFFVVKSRGPASDGTPEYEVLGEYVTPQDSLPKLRYFETNLVSLNDRCAVRKVKLNPKVAPIYVNGTPIGFC